MTVLTFLASTPLRLTSTLRVSALMVRPSTPTKLTLLLVACRLVQWRLVWRASVASTRPKSVPDMVRPSASAVPPFNPAKALTPLPPMVSMLTSTWLPSLRVTVSLLLRKAKLPFKLKKLKTLMFRLPEASSSSPLEPSMSKVMVLPGPARTARLVPLWSVGPVVGS